MTDDSDRGPAPEPALFALWQLRKASRVATCSAQAHPLGLEVVAAVDGEIVRTQVERRYGGRRARWRGLARGIPSQRLARMKRVFRFRPLDTLFPLPLTSTSIAAARAFVLYQDLRIEVACIWTSKLETAPPTITPDEIGVMYRRAYFLRRALATLEEFRQVAKTLGRQRAFVQAVHEHPLALQ
jgi:hypothetical protein